MAPSGHERRQAARARREEERREAREEERRQREWRETPLDVVLELIATWGLVWRARGRVNGEPPELEAAL